MHSVLIIGCGSIGERHLRCFQRTGRAQVTVCESNAEIGTMISDTYKVPVITGWQEAIVSGQYDSVVICTPAHLHIPMAIEALRYKRHVLIEKPLSQSLGGVDTLLRIHELSGCQAAVAYVFHVFPFLNQAREFIQSGALGSVRHVTLISGQPFHRLRPAHAVHYSKTYYRDRKLGGGAIQDALTHTVNWVESVIGATDSVLCDCAHQVLPGVTVEDTVNISAIHGDILVSYALNQFQAPNESSLQFNTATGSLKIEFHRQRWGVFRESDTDWTWHEAPVAERDSHFITQANYFLDQIEGQPARLCTLTAAAQTLRFNLAALASAECGGTRVACAALYG